MLLVCHGSEMMGERRALLDPEMYKISEEDSQDEEVLASYTEDALKLGTGRGLEDGNGNAAVNVVSHSRGSWNSQNEPCRYLAEYDDNRLSSWEYRGDLSSSQFNPSKLRIVHGLSATSRDSTSYHREKSSLLATEAPSSLCVVGSKNTANSEDHDKSVDWPETSTNSDSCLSGDDGGEKFRGRRAVYQHKSPSSSGAISAATRGFANAMCGNKFFGKTYFGDHLRDASKNAEHRGSEEQVGVELGKELPSHSSSTYIQDRHGLKPESFQQQPRSVPLQKRSRRRIVARNFRDNELSTSGSDCSDNNKDDNESISSSSNSPCAKCLNGSTRRSLGGVSQHHLHHHHKQPRSQTNVSSSSEVEEYDSSYSDSSYEERDEGEDEEDYDDDYYDEDDEGHECFDDIVKFLSDGEVEAGTNADGDLFLVEYSADESEEKAGFMEHSNRFHPLDKVTNPCIKLKNQLDGEECADNRPIPDSEARWDTQEAKDKPSSSTTSSTPTGKLQKSSAGKGARGRISRLLKRKRDTPSSSNIPVENSTTGPLPLSASSTTVETQHGQLAPPQATSNSSSTCSVTPATATTSSQSLLSGSGRKMKGNNSPSSSITASFGAPEKVFRFKDEHGGETRTVFVDIPQSARTGNLLGRRATLIESILGIIPGHFSTPLSSSNPHHDKYDNFFVTGASSNDRIMVAGFVPDGVASKYRRIKIGDWLQSVDDISVDHGNVDQVLNSRSMYGRRRTAFETEYLRIKLTLRRVAGCMVSLPQVDQTPESTSIRNSTVTTSVTEPCWTAVSPQVQANVAILFISSGALAACRNSATTELSSTTSVEAEPKEKSKDVVYSWPLESESKMVKALASSQGMFSTLYRLLRDVTGSHPIVSKVIIDDCEMDVTYASDDHGKSLLLVGIATSLSVFTIHHHHHHHSLNDSQAKGSKSSDISRSSNQVAVNGCSGTGPSSGETKKKEKKIRWREPQAGGVTVSTRVLYRVENLLKYQFGTYARAFQEGNLVKVNRLLSNSLSALNDLSEDFLFLQTPGNFLRFPNCIRSGIDDVLYSFETSDALNSGVSSSRPCRSSITSSRRHSKDFPPYPLPVYHCHGSCLMYKGLLITSHLENDLASSFHGWWRTQLGLWQGVRRNALLDKWKPVSRLAVWQETCILKKRLASPAKNQNGDGKYNNEADSRELGMMTAGATTYRPVRCFSGLVGIGNFTLGFVLEHLTDYEDSVGPDIDWLRRAMATLCRLYQSGLNRSLECWLQDKQGGREECIELCGTSPISSSKHSPPVPIQQKLESSGSSSTTSRSATLYLKKGTATGSILKNTESSSSPQQSNCQVHNSSTPGNMSITTSPSSSAACTSSQQVNAPSPFLQSIMGNSSSTASSSSSSFGGSGVLSGITGGISSTSPDGFSAMICPHPGGNGDSCDTYDSDGGDDMDADDATTGTGSDNSSFKWYERAASEPIGSAATRVSGGDVKQIRVTRENLLLDFMQVEFGRGVMLSSKDIHEGWAAAVRHNFRQSVTVIHHILHKAANARQRLEDRGSDRKWVSLALAPISEHGILFNCQVTNPRDVHKKKPRKREINYWVVGRIYPEEREIYVCYEDGPLSQNLVEIAYKLALNVHC